MRVGSLFTGIGGIDLGLERAGMRVVWQVECDPYCVNVLERHWPGVHRRLDVRLATAANLGPCDLIAGGFPCQDISAAGKGAGLERGHRSGLWREFARLVGELEPRYVLVENVPALRGRGADIVLGDLEAAGYACWPLVVGARHVGAPHRRDRVWIVGRRDMANDSGLRRGREALPAGREDEDGTPTTDALWSRDGGADAGVEDAAGERGRAPGADEHGRGDLRADGACGAGAGLADADGRQRQLAPGNPDVGRTAEGAGSCDEPPRASAGLADAGCERGEWGPTGAGGMLTDGSVGRAESHGESSGAGRHGVADRDATRLEGRGLSRCERADEWPAGPGSRQHDWEQPRTVESPVGRAAHGISARLASARWRNELKALGNAVVPQVVEVIGRAILALEGGGVP